MREVICDIIVADLTHKPAVGNGDRMIVLCHGNKRDLIVQSEVSVKRKYIRKMRDKLIDTYVSVAELGAVIGIVIVSGLYLHVDLGRIVYA